MKRLTIELGSCIVGYKANNKTLAPAELSVGQTREILKRLCDYENTGLTPEEIFEMKKSANIKKCQRKGIVGVPKNSDRTIAEFDLKTNQEPLAEYGGTADSIRKGIEIIKSEQSYSSRINSVNDAIKYLAENNAFSLKSGKLILNDECIPDFKNGQMNVCNSKAKTISRIKNACE